MPVVAGPADETPAEETPKPKRSRRRKPVSGEGEGTESADEKAPTEAPAEPAIEEKPKRTRRKKVETPATEVEPAAEAPAPEAKPKRVRKKPAPADAGGAEAAAAESPAMMDTPVADQSKRADAESAGDDKPRRGGWWQRTFGE